MLSRPQGNEQEINVHELYITVGSLRIGHITAGDKWAIQVETELHVLLINVLWLDPLTATE